MSAGYRAYIGLFGIAGWKKRAVLLHSIGMIVRSPCPKCREPLLPGVSECGDCHYTLMSHEISRAVWMFRLKLATSAVAIGTLVYLLANR